MADSLPSSNDSPAQTAVEEETKEVASPEMVETEQGEFVPRGPIGVTSEVVSPMGYTVEMDELGMPIFKNQLSSYRDAINKNPLLASILEDKT